MRGPVAQIDVSDQEDGLSGPVTVTKDITVTFVVDDAWRMSSVHHLR